MNPLNNSSQATMHMIGRKKIILLNLNLHLLKLTEYGDIYHFINVNTCNFSNIEDMLLQNGRNIDTIVADYGFLVQNDFAEVKNINRIYNNKKTTIIAIKGGIHLLPHPPSVLLINGIDDCYEETNFEIKDLVSRIEFLRKFKKQATQFIPLATETLNLKMPYFKRLFDIAISTLALVLLSPVFLLTAFMIRLESKGPIIYRSRRIGWGYQEFNFLKFRSMYDDADNHLKEVQKFNQYKDNNAIFIKIKNDPRVTKVGRIIRKYSIDELPQLFNVFLGHMSIIGNRPLPLYEAELLTKEDAAYRFLAPAGITGLWQVTKRGKNNMLSEERIHLDITYTAKMSFWFDIKILFKTPFSLVQKENV